MPFIRKFASKFAVREALVSVALSLMMLATYACQAQGPSFAQNNDPLESNGRRLGATLYSAAHEAAALGSAPAPADTSPTADDQWHIGLPLYLWFAGMHGYVGRWALTPA